MDLSYGFWLEEIYRLVEKVRRFYNKSFDRDSVLLGVKWSSIR